MKRTYSNIIRITFGICLVFWIAACSLDDPSTDPTDDVGTDDDMTDDDPIDPVGFAGEIEWLHTFGGSNVDEAVSITITLDGGFLVLGTTQSIDGDVSGRTGDDADYWLLKLNSAGELQWEQTYGGTEDDRATSISLTADGGYIISGYSRSTDGDVTGNEGFYDFWLVKVTSSGTLVWEQNFGFSGNDQAFDVFETADGGFFATGFLDVSASGGAGDDFQDNGSLIDRGARHGVGEFWAIRMDADGNKLWRRYFGGTNNDRSSDALQTSDGGFLMVGSSESEDFDITDGKGSYDLWVVRLQPNGDLLWTKSFGGSQIDIGYSVTQDSDGTYILVGDARSADQDVTSAKGNADVWVVKFNDSGNMIWQRSYGGPDFESARNIVPLSNGQFAITGNSRSNSGDLDSNQGQNDAWLLVINSSGSLITQVNFGGSGLDFADGAAETADNKIVIVGNTESTDGDITENKGSKDILVALLK